MFNMPCWWNIKGGGWMPGRGEEHLSGQFQAARNEKKITEYKRQKCRK
jgi:hypothetical protein